MPYPIEDKLVIAVASSVLFQLDEADAVFREKGVRAYRAYQREHEADVLKTGIAFPFVRRFLELNKDEREEKDSNYRRFLKTAIVTARSAPAHKRVINTLRAWNITVDETHFLGGMDKGRVLETLRPHIFFDDQQHPHLDSAQAFTPSVLIPFGVSQA